MARFVRNDAGTIHSVVDDFTLPEGWEEASEADASPQLRGTGTDPAVDAVELHDRAEAPVPDSDDIVAEPVTATPTKEAPVV